MERSSENSWKVILRGVGLVQSEYLSLRMVDRLKPATWTVLPSNGNRTSLCDKKFARDFFNAVLPDSKDVYVSIDQEANGEHIFISLKDTKAALLGAKDMSLKTYRENEVKRLRDLKNPLLFARPDKGSSTRIEESKSTEQNTEAETLESELNIDEVNKGASAERAKEKKSEEDSEVKYSPGLERAFKSSDWLSSMASSKKNDLNLWSFLSTGSKGYSRSSWTNYSICPEVSIGPTQKIILSDESTLCSPHPEEKIFDHLVLIVNCREDNCDTKKYEIGSCTTDKPPEVLSYAVHKWHAWSGPEVALKINVLNHEIQEKIWKCLQRGTVAVHCLAGIHRAACIVACHYLYRYHHLKQKDIPHESAEIYRCLEAVRPAVSPAYKHVLQSYEKFLLEKDK